MNESKIIKKFQHLAGRAEALKKEMVRDRYIKLESKPFSHSSLQGILDNSNMEQVRGNLNETILLEGVGALVLLELTTHKIFVNLRGVQYTKLGNELVSITGNTCQTVRFQNQTLELFINYQKVGLKTVIEHYVIVGEQKEINVITQKSFEGKIPAWVFQNNYRNESEIEFYGVQALFDRLNLADCLGVSELAKSRSMVIVSAMTGNENAKKIEKELENWQAAITDKTTASAIGGGGIAITPANSEGQTLMLSEVLEIEDILRKELGLKRDKDTSGTNKTILEIVDKDEAFLETLTEKQRARQKDYNIFFDNVCNYLQLTKDTIQLELSDMLQIKLKLLEASVLETQMKKDNVSSQINGEEKEEEKPEENEDE